MENLAARVNLTQTAGGGATRKAFFHPGKTIKLKRMRLYPNATSAVHASNYVDIAIYVGSTQIGSTRSTNSSTGSALTLATVETFDISSVAPSSLEVSETNPLTLRATQAASGVAIDVDYLITYEDLQ